MCLVTPIQRCERLTSATGVDSLYETITRRNRKPMIQPKDLYRKLAMLLAEIDEGRDKEDYLLSVLARLDNSFTRDLHLTDGRLYAEEHEQFLPMYAADGREPVHLDEDRRALDSEAAQLVLKNGIYRSEERRVGKECRSRWSPYH